MATNKISIFEHEQRSPYNEFRDASTGVAGDPEAYIDGIINGLSSSINDSDQQIAIILRAQKKEVIRQALMKLAFRLGTHRITIRF